MRIVILSVALLAGCASVPSPVVIQKPKEVEVPLVEPCNVVMPKVPEWEMDKIQPTDMFTRMEAALKEIEQRRAYEAELEASLNYCIKPHEHVEVKASE